MSLSAALHGSLLALVWLSTQYTPPEMEFLTYEVELVSPPPAQRAEEVRPPAEELVVERPEPEPLPPEPEVEEMVPVEEPEPDPPPPPPRPPEEPVERPPEPREDPVVAAAPEPVEETPEVSGEGLNVRIEGLRRDYPEYYNNIIRQIQRCFRWQGGGRWQTTVLFWITRDGTATDLSFQRRSGNTAFDFDAMGAVECAGRGQFGPLPEDLPYERFPILFQFQPSGELMAFPSEAGVSARGVGNR